jgi:hypothetical protein
LNPQHYARILDSLTDRLTYVCLLCEDQAKELEVDVDEFEDRLMGEGYADAASMAFLEESHDFFRRLGQKGPARLAELAIRNMKQGRENLEVLLNTGRFDSLLQMTEPEAIDDALNESAENDGSSSPS